MKESIKDKNLVNTFIKIPKLKEEEEKRLIDLHNPLVVASITKAQKLA